MLGGLFNPPLTFVVLLGIVETFGTGLKIPSRSGRTTTAHMKNQALQGQTRMRLGAGSQNVQTCTLLEVICL
jgi:hypothetical protein